MFARNTTVKTRSKISKQCFGWDGREQQRKRLLAFIKGIQVSGLGITAGAVGVLNEFSINLDTFDYDHLTFELTSTRGDGKSIVVALDHILIEHYNHIKIRYKVSEPGRYFLGIKYHDLHVPCSPFKVQIRQSQSRAIDVSAFGKGLHQYVTGKLSRFHLDLSRGGYGKISVVPSSETYGANDVQLCAVNDTKYGYEVQYVASTTGPIFFHVKLNGKHINGSPFLVKDGTSEGVVKKTKMLFRQSSLLSKKNARIIMKAMYEENMVKQP